MNINTCPSCPGRGTFWNPYLPHRAAWWAGPLPQFLIPISCTRLSLDEASAHKPLPQPYSHSPSLLCFGFCRAISSHSNGFSAADEQSASFWGACIMRAQMKGIAVAAPSWWIGCVAGRASTPPSSFRPMNFWRVSLYLSWALLAAGGKRKPPKSIIYCRRCEGCASIVRPCPWCWEESACTLEASEDAKLSKKEHTVGRERAKL